MSWSKTKVVRVPVQIANNISEILETFEKIKVLVDIAVAILIRTVLLGSMTLICQQSTSKTY